MKDITELEIKEIEDYPVIDISDEALGECMTDIDKKRGEIRDGLTRIINEGKVNRVTAGVTAKKAVRFLVDEGVVIKVDRKHDSDCSVHNMPAYPNGPCDCVVLPVGCVTVKPLIGGNNE